MRGHYSRSAGSYSRNVNAGLANSRRCRCCPNTEGADRESIELPEEQDQMIKAVLEANKRTIVVLNRGSIVLLNQWADRAPAIVQAWYPGQDDGNVIADVLFGVVNPSGKLPLTFPRARQDVAVSSPQQYPGVSEKGQYSEGLFIGYRHERSFAFYDPNQKKWIVEPGQFKVLVGSSSRDIRLTASFNID